MMLYQQNRYELESSGFTVVPGVVSSEDCDRHQEHFRKWLGTFPEGSFPQNINSVIQRYKVGHMPPAWEVRLAAKKVYAEVWGTEKLLTSIDGVAIGRPPEDGQEAFWDESNSWLHVDQSADKVGLHAYQGSVFLETCDEDDWAFQVIEGSHKYFEEFMKNKGQWRCRNIGQNDLDWFEKKGCTRKRIPCPKGGMVLWDSRLFHANARPIKGRQNPGRWRFVVFVCMGPACWASPSDLQIKREAYEEMELTSHWPSQEVTLFFPFICKNRAKDPGGLDTLPEIARSDEVKRLVGVLPYESKDGEEEEEEENPFRPRWDKETWIDFINEFKTDEMALIGK